MMALFRLQSYIQILSNNTCNRMDPGHDLLLRCKCFLVDDPAILHEHNTIIDPENPDDQFDTGVAGLNLEVLVMIYKT